MYSLSSTDGWYDGRPVTSGSTPLNLRFARSSSSTNTSITRTGLSSQIQSSRHSGNSVLWWRSVPSTKRFIRSLRKPRRNHNPRITSLSGFLHNQDPKATSVAPCDILGEGKKPRGGLTMQFARPLLAAFALGSMVALPARAEMDVARIKATIETSFEVDYPKLDALYKDLHARPELAFEEVK